MRKQAAAMIKRSEMAYGHIFSALPNDVALMVKVVPQGWARGLWLWLENKFRSTASDNVNTLLRDWHSLRQAEGESFDLYRARVDDLHVRLAAAKEKPSPRAYAYALVNSLLPQYDVVVMALETGMLLNVQDYAKISWDDVARIINMHERKVVAQSAKDAEAASAKAMAVQHFHRKQQSPQCMAVLLEQLLAAATERSESTPGCAGSAGSLDISRPHAPQHKPGGPAAAAQTNTKGTGSADQQGKRQEHVSVAVGAHAHAVVAPLTAVRDSRWHLVRCCGSGSWDCDVCRSGGFGWPRRSEAHRCGLDGVHSCLF